MPEPMDVPPTLTADPRGTVDDRALVSLIGVGVLAVDGVARLEPSVKSLLRNRILGGTSGPGSPDGITATSFGLITDVTVDLATTARHQSKAVADSVQRVVADLLEAQGREPGRIRVNVLAIDQSIASAD